MVCEFYIFICLLFFFLIKFVSSLMEQSYGKSLQLCKKGIFLGKFVFFCSIICVMLFVYIFMLKW